MSNVIARHIRKECTINGISNVFFNALIAWLLLKGGTNLSFAGENSFAVDLIATGFILPFIVTLIIIPLNRRQLQKQLLPSITLNQNHWLEGRLAKFPRGLFMRAVLFGYIGMLLLTPLTLLPLWLLGVEQFNPLDYALFKGLWAGAIAALLAAPMIIVALSEQD